LPIRKWMSANQPPRELDAENQRSSHSSGIE
jgi:hypothetical protein